MYNVRLLLIQKPSKEILSVEKKAQKGLPTLFTHQFISVLSYQLKY